jgi:uncharacterized protein (DUF433 family)
VAHDRNPRYVLRVQKLEGIPAALTEEADGVLRVTGTRVPLDTVVTAFDQDASAEQIVDRFPTLDIASVNEVIAYVVRNRAAVDEYMATRRAEAVRLRAEIEKRFPNEGLRAKLLARRNRGVS